METSPEGRLRRILARYDLLSPRESSDCCPLFPNEHIHIFSHMLVAADTVHMFPPSVSPVPADLYGFPLCALWKVWFIETNYSNQWKITFRSSTWKSTPAAKFSFSQFSEQISAGIDYIVG